MAQLAFDLEAIGLVLDPTTAMRAGTQRAFQCSYCGTVVVRPSSYADVPLSPTCHVCLEAPWWWAQSFPICGLRPIEPDVSEEADRG